MDRRRRTSCRRLAVDKIGGAIDVVDYVAVVLSKTSVNSEWVQRELRLALTNEFQTRRVIVLPILLEDVVIPAFLRDKLYADFTPDADRPKSFKSLLNAIQLRQPVGGTREENRSPRASKVRARRTSLSSNSAFQNDLRTILEQFRGDRVHFAPHVPEDILRNAAEICKFTNWHELICVFDYEKRLWRSGGKTAVIFASTGVYFGGVSRNDGSTLVQRFIPYGKLEDAHVHVDWRVVFSPATRSNDVYHSLEIGSESMHLPSTMFALDARVAE